MLSTMFSSAVQLFRGWMLPLTGITFMAAACDGKESAVNSAPKGDYRFIGQVIESADISGAAMVSPTRGLIAADEGTTVQVVELDRVKKTIKIIQDVRINYSGTEVDAEGVATDGENFFIIGSHGVARKKGSYQATRYHVFRLPVDPKTALPTGQLSPKTSIPVNVSKSSLSDILSTDPTLSPRFKMALQKGGLNIEGLAYRNGLLHAGFRGPNLGGNALVLAISPAELFSDKKDRVYKLKKVALGKGFGIREIIPTKSGFLIIGGNAGVEPSKNHATSVDYQKGRGYNIYYWSGGGPAVQKLAAIPNPPGKAEGMILLDETEASYSVLVFFDSAKNGAPTVYEIPR